MPRASIHRKPHCSGGGTSIKSRLAASTQAQLLRQDKTNQSQFFNFFLHMFDVSVGNGVAAEKNLLLTVFAQRKYTLWKRCGLSFVDVRLLSFVQTSWNSGRNDGVSFKQSRKIF
jgi:hypothetical protein